eukprot:TRINITY_DN3359_c0_g1_i7.p1 TRINITY_DN3359_c0_g1~~TRINITY_DN3359_c0_g1_i7.p1  ORF type:complete len:132 (+),score=10.93 TRINITY_DN3359_c0_g1_i7:203-598(+)
MRLVTINALLMLTVPFACYHYWHGPREDPRYKFPCTLSHTIRRPAPARWAYQLGYALFLVPMVAMARRRRAVGAWRSTMLLIAGAAHIFVSVPEPEEVIASPGRSKMRELAHFGGAGACVFGLGCVCGCDF